jgi:hypothetical protein
LRKNDTHNNDIRHLIPLEQACILLKRVSNLTLNPPKCFMVPFGKLMTLSVIDVMCEWFICHVPNWASLAIKSSAKYLGFFLRPKGGSNMWCSAIAKWQDRAAILSNSQRTSTLVIPIYNSRCVPILGYIAQLIPLPVGTIIAERQILQRLFHVLQHTFPPTSSSTFVIVSSSPNPFPSWHCPPVHECALRTKLFLSGVIFFPCLIALLRTPFPFGTCFTGNAAIVGGSSLRSLTLWPKQALGFPQISQNCLFRCSPERENSESPRRCRDLSPMLSMMFAIR